MFHNFHLFAEKENGRKIAEMSARSGQLERQI